ncbi:hemolysin III family protein [Nocardioides guangzhouensis]|uniref:hemolysin III family protein n=1 Tax=Nocardioides guangzhouensis TaxID=2497878 RepID=UPI001C375F53|nr:hemolysin III family protein [Nocardioides guangzhouensis]
MPDLFGGALRLGGDAGGATLFLLVAGAGLYVTGAVVYFFQRPDPWPRWFGFHEVFHAFTVLAFLSHYAGISVATLAMR